MPARQRLDLAHPLKGAAATSELVKRLKHAHDQLRDFDQDLVDTSSLDQLAAQLRQPNLLLHKDKGVKAYAACCLVDVLRLYAPEAPYTPAQLKDIFDFLIRQFRFVGAPTDPHQAEYFYVVDSLASVKSIVLICDLDAADDLIERVFRESFDTISTTSPKNVELALCDILLALLEEVPNVPTAVTDILTAQFLPRAVKQRPAAHRLATEVCRGASDKLQRYISQYFGETIVAAMNGGGGRGAASSDEESAVEEDDDDDSEDGAGAKKRRGRKAKTKAKGKLKETNGGVAKVGDKDSDLPPALVEAHDLIRSLNRHVPALLLNVIPQLAEELTTSSPAYRRLATGALGAMFGEPVGRGDLARAFPAVWRAWLARARDREASVRARMCECMRRIWREHPELAGDLAHVLVGALLEDKDEKVRVAACAVFEDVDYETASHHVPRRVLEAVGGRVVDKKEKVRTVACKVLGRLYDLSFPEIESRDDHTLKQFGWIPGVLLDSLTATDSTGAGSAAHRHLVNATLLASILPQPKSDKDAGEPDVLAAWVDRFLLVERALATDEQRRALMVLTRLADKRGASVWEGYIGACESYNSGIVDDKKQGEAIKDFLKRAIRTIASNMPDPAKASEDLMTFAQQNVAQLYRELRALLDPQTDLRVHIKNARDLFRRVEKFPHGESCAQTFDAFVRMASYPLLNRSSIPQLLRRLTATSGDDASAWAAGAARVLEYVCKTRAVLFKAHAAELAKILSECAPAAAPAEGGTVPALLLHALACLKQADDAAAIDAKLSKNALRFARESHDEREAKLAATLIALDRGKPGTLDDLVEFLADEIPTASDATLVARLAALARIALHGQPAFERRAESLVASSLEVLTRVGGADEALQPDQDDDEGATWVDACDPLTRARVLAVKVVANRCLAYKGSDEAQKVQQEAFTVLWPLLTQHGGHDGTTYSPPVASRVRLAVALAILKLFASQDKHYVQAILPRLDLLARTAQDATYEVREAFLKKLVTYLRQNRFHPGVVPRLNMVLFLVAHEPEEDLKESVLAFAKGRKRLPDTQRQQQWELPFLRLLHLLAHHPDFEGADTTDVEILKVIAKYIEEYLEIFATAENLSFFYHLALSAKSVRDRQAPDSENLYILSDLSQHLLKLLAARHAWPISTYPGQAQLPADLFTKFASADAARAVAKREFVPAETLKEISALRGDKKERKKVVARKRASAASGVPKAKRARTSKAPSTPRGKKKADKWDSDAESSAAEEDDDETDDESSAGEDASDDDGAREKPARGTIATKARPAPRGSRGGLRSDPRKSLKKGLGEDGAKNVGRDDDDDDDARSATAEQEGDEVEMEVDAASKEDDEHGKPARGRKAKAKASSPAKKKAPAAAKGKKAAPGTASTNGISSAKGKKQAAAASPDKHAGNRRALRGLAQPHALKKADVEAVSDIGETDDGAEQMSE
ncbi:hypothetical protein JCM3770_007070 [Rhodotorula araucariae]